MIDSSGAMTGFHDDEVLGKAYDARLMRRLLAYLRPYWRQVAVAFSLDGGRRSVQLGGDYVSINLLVLDNVEPAKIEVVYWDGRHNNWAGGTRETPWPVGISISPPPPSITTVNSAGVGIEQCPSPPGPNTAPPYTAEDCDPQADASAGVSDYREGCRRTRLVRLSLLGPHAHPSRRRERPRRLCTATLRRGRLPRRWW